MTIFDYKYLKLLVVFVVVSCCASCSFFFVDSPPVYQEPSFNVAPDCTTSLTLPIMDAVFGAMMFSLATGTFLVTEEDDRKRGAIGGQLATSAIWGVSSVVGFAKTSNCKDYVEVFEKRRLKYVPPVFEAELIVSGNLVRDCSRIDALADELGVIFYEYQEACRADEVGQMFKLGRDAYKIFTILYDKNPSDTSLGSWKDVWVNLWTNACLRGHPEACYAAMTGYNHPHMTRGGQEHWERQELFVRACDLGLKNCGRCSYLMKAWLASTCASVQDDEVD